MTWSPEFADAAAPDVDSRALQDAVEYAKIHDTPSEQLPYDFSSLGIDTEEEHATLIGPMPDRRGGPSGVVLKDGHVLAEWGDTTRVEHAFSISKSFLSIVGGVAYDRGHIADVTDPVREYIDGGGFDSPHNSEITWEQLFQQTSEWEGTLFGKPDVIDRYRPVGTADLDGEKGTPRELREPGTYWEYNDVRVNQLALSLLRLWKKPLYKVLQHEVMNPIGASSTWEWHGYYNSDVEIDGQRMKSVSGGGHWGGGVWMNTRDLARVGQLMLNGGSWGEKQILSPEWIDMATTPCSLQPTYGYLWWLNEDRALWPSAPESSFAAIGSGSNVVWVDPEHDLVVVSRWLKKAEQEGSRRPNMDELFQRVISAVQ
ncbi:serine hydrolase domain-containing protein [Salinirarus marinus]|uniref:serine hydrolase domain-containing protein n=1 Tax=Salinirarus marinus TaxID=3068310 RepID=UPI003C6C76F8